jgi:hypothetical protein
MYSFAKQRDLVSVVCIDPGFLLRRFTASKRAPRAVMTRLSSRAYGCSMKVHEVYALRKVLHRGSGCSYASGLALLLCSQANPALYS